MKNVKRMALIIFTAVLLFAGALVTMIVGSAEEYCTVRIDYLFQNGDKAYDSYIAVFNMNADVNVTITNPTISGYKPVDSLNEAEAQPAPTTLLTGKMTENRTLRVWYVPDIVPYTVKYYKQNVYDDDYTADLTLDDAYYDKSGKTGTFPSDLENVTFPGFTKLYHKPDFIAADGSTEFELYYTRNYYLINFDLNGGHGVEPVYAKYESNYNIPEPARKGYVFEGWVPVDDSGSYVDDNGVALNDTQALAYAREHKFTSGVVPDHNVNYKAYWTASEAQYTIVYWIEDPDSDNYEDVATQTITQYRNETAVTTGDTLDLEDRNEIPDFFTGYNLNPQMVERNADNTVKLDKDLRPTYMTNKDYWEKLHDDPFPEDARVYPIDEDGDEIDFPDMSPGEREEFNGKGRYFEINTELSSDNVEISGDGTTKFNVYYKRLPITQRFFFARKTADGKYQVPGWTRAFSTQGGTLNNHLSDNWGRPTHWQELNGSLPEYADEYKTKLDANTHTYEANGYTYYYYELKTEYYSNMRDNWLSDAFKPYAITNTTLPDYHAGDYARFGAWSAEYGTPYAIDHDNKTVKAIYEKLDDQLLYRESYLDAGYVDDPLVLNYLSFWTNAKNANWNYKNAVYNFTYQNYVELLPSEYNADGTWNGTGGYTSVIAVNYDVDSSNQVMHSQRKLYGLLPENIIETYDGAAEYKNVNNRDKDVKDMQTATSLTGFALLESEINKVTSAQVVYGADTGADINLKKQNPVCKWYAKDEFDENHHADIKFFYRRRYYTLGFMNNNVKSTDQQTRNIYYQMDINSTGIRGNWVYYEPEYPDKDMRNYYYFDGWYYDEDHTRKVPIIENDTTYADNDHPEGRTHFADNDFKMPADDVTLFAKWNLVKENVRFYNDYEAYSTSEDPISSCEPEYNSLILTQYIPTTNHEDSRPDLTPPSEGATFTGWYYLNEAGEELRFEPENIPVVKSLNLYAKWTSEQSAGYLVEYVEKGTDTPVADPVTGVAYVTTTKSFNAKVGNELNEAHRPQANQKNWWPVVSSHSIVINANEEGEDYAPNVYRFEYTKKENVWYTVKYLDAATLEPLFPDEEKNTSAPTVTEYYRPKDGYMPDRVQKTLILSASVNTNTDAAKAEELAMNTIVFLYTKKDSQALVRIEHYLQKPDGDPADKNDYEHYRDERITKLIGDNLDLEADVYTTPIARSLTDSHYNIRTDFTEVYVNNELFTGQTITVTNAPLVVKVYYERSKYPYKVICVDIDRQDNPQGVLKTTVYSDAADQKPLGAVVTIEPESPITDSEGNKYVPIDPNNQTLTIYHEDFNGTAPPDPKINVKTIYYRKLNSVQINYEIICEGAVEGDLQLSQNREIVKLQTDIKGCTATDYSGVDGRYTFLGWFKTPVATDENENRLTTADQLFYKPEALPLNDVTYYAIFQMNSAPYTLNYAYQGRKGANDGGSYVGDDAETDDKVYTVTLELKPEDLDENGMPLPKHLVDNAPAVDDLYKDCIWTINDDHVTYDKTTRTVTITAVQKPREYIVEFYYAEHSAEPETVTRVPLNSLVRRDDGSFIEAPETDDAENPFAYWSVVENDKEIARCYNRGFNLRVTGDYTITAMYTTPANVLSISDPRYTRQQYDDANGNKVDKLQVDFLLAYMQSKGLLLNSNLAAEQGYSSGVVVEYFDNRMIEKADVTGAKLSDNDKATVTLPGADPNSVKTFIQSSSNSTANDHQHLLKYIVPNSYYNNKNRVDRAISFTNSESARHMVFRAYYYVSHTDGDKTVTELTDPVTFYLYDIGNSASNTEGD